MRNPEQLMHAIGCLQQLAGDPLGLSARQIARAEGLEPSASGELLACLHRAGVIEPVVEGAPGYRLSREPGRIRLADIGRALGVRAGGLGLDPRVTLGDLLGWETQVFDDPQIPRAA